MMNAFNLSSNSRCPNSDQPYMIYHYYSEYLTRLKTIVLSIELADHEVPLKLRFITPSTIAIEEETGKPSEQGSISVQLPGRVSNSGVKQVIDIPANNKDISLKFSNCSLTEENASLVSKQGSSFSENPNFAAPWSTNQLNQCRGCRTVCCAQCGSTVIGDQVIQEFKALPSENWAEMMDFWHCHKPHEESTSHNSSYAQSSFKPYKGTCFVADSYLMLETFDVEASTEKIQCICKNCSTIMGEVIDKTTLKLWKWSIKLTPGVQNDDVPSCYSASIYVYTAIAQLIDAHACYTFSLLDTETMQEQLMLWVVNPDIWVTSTSNTTPRRCMKIVFAVTPNEKDELMQNRIPEPIKFPKRFIDTFLSDLQESQALLPANGRHFGHCNVSLLSRL